MPFRLIQVWLPVTIGLLMLLTAPGFNFGRVMDRLGGSGYPLGVAASLLVLIASVAVAADTGQVWAAAEQGFMFTMVGLATLSAPFLINTSWRQRVAAASVGTGLPSSRGD